MAGTAVNVRREWSLFTLASGVARPFLRAVYEELNKVITDLEVLRAASWNVFDYKVENLAAGADITERAFFQAPFALTVQDSVKALQEAASVGVDGSNTAIITLRNITEAVDVATITLVANVAANAATALTLTAANADIAAGDILGVVVTQGAATDLSSFVLQFTFRPQTVDAAADLTAASLSTIESGD